MLSISLSVIILGQLILMRPGEDQVFFKYCRKFGDISYNNTLFHVPKILGNAVAQWLRCCATNRKVVGSIPVSISGFFIDIKFFRSHYGPEVESASNRNECQEYFLGVKAAGA